MLLEQRTAEADKSKLNAQIARNEASDANRNSQVAQNEAANAQRNTQLALSEAAKAKQGAQVAQADAAGAQRLAQEAQARSAQLEAQLSELAAKKTACGDVITLGDVLFGTDLARLNADGMRNAQKLVTLLQDNPQRTVLVEGFADSTGSAAHNQDLSERRANAARWWKWAWRKSVLQFTGMAKSFRWQPTTQPRTANSTAESRSCCRTTRAPSSPARHTR